LSRLLSVMALVVIPPKAASNRFCSWRLRRLCWAAAREVARVEPLVPERTTAPVWD
jgi:hypothetical protein